MFIGLSCSSWLFNEWKYSFWFNVHLFVIWQVQKMICPVKSANLIFTFLILSCCFPRAAKKQKKAIVSISSTKQQRDDDSSRTICTKNLFWSLSLSKSCKDLERIVIHIRVEIRTAVHSLSWALSQHKNDSLSYAWWNKQSDRKSIIYLYLNKNKIIFYYSIWNSSLLWRKHSSYNAKTLLEIY